MTIKAYAALKAGGKLEPFDWFLKTIWVDSK
jgi:hypothetical protein